MSVRVRVRVIRVRLRAGVRVRARAHPMQSAGSSACRVKLAWVRDRVSLPEP